MADNRKCEVCNKDEFKYRCPKCGIRTCCLSCVNVHKQKINCDGVRDRTEYVPLKEFNELTLLSDYRLLEETARCVDNAARHSEGHRKPPPHKRLPPYLHRLVLVCRDRGASLIILPKIFQRRKRNNTYYDFKTRRLVWTIEWEFPQAGVKYTDDRVPEDLSLGKAVEKYFSPDDCKPDINQSLIFYQSAGCRDVVPLMKVDRNRSKETGYVELDFSESLTANFYGKRIVEFPTILLVLKAHIQCYPILELDDGLNDKEDGEVDDDGGFQQYFRCNEDVATDSSSD